VASRKEARGSHPEPRLQLCNFDRCIQPGSPTNDRAHTTAASTPLLGKENDVERNGNGARLSSVCDKVGRGTIFDDGSVK